MTETLSRHDSGMSLENNDRVDFQVARKDLFSVDEAHQLIEDTNERARLAAERAPLTPQEHLGQLNLRVVGVRRNHVKKLNQGDFDLAG